MKKIKFVSIVLLLIAAFITFDLGFNYLHAITDSLSGTGDGIAIYGIFARILIGDRGWSYAAYLKAFEICAWITFIVLIENAAVCISDILRAKKQ